MTLFGILTPTGWITRLTASGPLTTIDASGLAYTWKTHGGASDFAATYLLGTDLEGVVTEIPAWVLR